MTKIEKLQWLFITPGLVLWIPAIWTVTDEWRLAFTVTECLIMAAVVGCLLLRLRQIGNRRA